MSAVMLLALLLQAISVVLLRQRLGKLWLRRPVTILVLVSVVYQGVSQVLLCIPSIRGWDNFRTGVQQNYVGQAMLLLSAAMLAFTIAYLLTRPERAVPGGADIRELAGTLDWRLLALCCAPLAYLTYEGRGYNSALTTGQGAPPATVLASSFFVILVGLTAFALVVRKGPQWFLPVAAAQSVLLAAAGERTPVVTDFVVLLVLMCHAGMRPASRQLHLAALMVVVAILAVNGVRAEHWRSGDLADTSLGARVSALGESLSAGGAEAAGPGVLASAAERLDGVSFTAGILQAESFGQPRLGAAYVPESLLVAVPSVLWPSKIASNAALLPVPVEIYGFGLPRVNFLPGLPGMFTGVLSPSWLIAFLAFLGVLAGWGERCLLRSASPARFVMLASAVSAAMLFEQGVQGMVIALRTGALGGLAVIAVGILAGGLREAMQHRPARYNWK
jgi:hypothetical protein